MVVIYLCAECYKMLFMKRLSNGSVSSQTKQNIVTPLSLLIFICTENNSPSFHLTICCWMSRHWTPPLKLIHTEFILWTLKKRLLAAICITAQQWFDIEQTKANQWKFVYILGGGALMHRCLWQQGFIWYSLKVMCYICHRELWCRCHYFRWLHRTICQPCDHPYRRWHWLAWPPSVSWRNWWPCTVTVDDRISFVNLGHIWCNLSLLWLFSADTSECYHRHKRKLSSVILMHACEILAVIL